MPTRRSAASSLPAPGSARFQPVATFTSSARMIAATPRRSWMPTALHAGQLRNCRCTKPTIGMINGLAYGGAAVLASSLDMRVGCEDSGMDTLLLVLDLIGTFVFALSGAMAGVKSRLDLFGVLGLSY